MSEAKRKAASLATFLLLMFIALIVTLHMVAPYLLTVVMGGILAVLVHPLYVRTVRKRVRPATAAVLITAGLFLLVIVPLLGFTVIAVKQGVAMAQSLSGNTNFSFHNILEKVHRWGPIQAVVGSTDQLESQAREYVQTLGESGSKIILGLVANVPGLILDLILAAVTCYFFLVDGGHFLNWLADKIPLDPDVRIGIRSSFEDTAVSTMWSAMAGALVQAGVLIVGFLVLGVPALFLAGGVAFILAWIPLLGSIPVWLAGMAYLWSQHSFMKLGILFGFAIVAAVADNIIRPWVLKGRGDMHGLVGLVAIFGGIDRFGIFGVFYGPIAVAICLSLLKFWPVVAKRFGITFSTAGMEVET